MMRPRIADVRMQRRERDGEGGERGIQNKRGKTMKNGS
jgi:hypothetical protein